eukprot:evm.model.scf_394.7 EVM.evm.TU.scf_394.7   scf_394:77162-80937(-)
MPHVLRFVVVSFGFRTSTAGGPAYYVLQYDFVPNIIERRKPYRAVHLSLAEESAKKGKLLLGGARGDPPGTSLWIFKNSSKEEVEAYARNDPYVQNGLVTSWNVQPWDVVRGCLMDA